MYCFSHLLKLGINQPFSILHIPGSVLFPTLPHNATFTQVPLNLSDGPQRPYRMQNSSLTVAWKRPAEIEDAQCLRVSSAAGCWPGELILVRRELEGKKQQRASFSPLIRHPTAFPALVSCFS